MGTQLCKKVFVQSFTAYKSATSCTKRHWNWGSLISPDVIKSKNLNVSKETPRTSTLWRPFSRLTVGYAKPLWNVKSKTVASKMIPVQRHSVLCSKLVLSCLVHLHSPKMIKSCELSLQPQKDQQSADKVQGRLSVRFAPLRTRLFTNMPRLG